MQSPDATNLAKQHLLAAAYKPILSVSAHLTSYPLTIIIDSLKHDHEFMVIEALI